MGMSKRKVFCRGKNTCKPRNAAGKRRIPKKHPWSSIPSFIGIGKTFVTESIQQSGKYVFTEIQGAILGFRREPHFIFQHIVMYARVAGDRQGDYVHVPCSMISKEKTLDWWKAAGDAAAQMRLTQKWAKQGTCRCRHGSTPAKQTSTIVPRLLPEDECERL